MKLIKAYPIEIGIIQYLNENAYINDTAEGALKMALRWLAEAPAVDPEELRPKGRWIYLGESYFDTVYKCSECGHPEKMNKKCKKNYCHNCGCRMEE